jgi:hypothetical protein
LKSIGTKLERLGQLRNRADYNMSALPDFATDKTATGALAQANDALDLLDAIAADPSRQAAAIAAIPKTIP